MFEIDAEFKKLPPRMSKVLRAFGYCAVYVMAADAAGPCKVGVCVDVLKRRRTLRKQAAGLKVYSVRWLPDVSLALRVERRALALLRSVAASRGEWFDLPPAFADAGVCEAVRVCEFPMITEAQRRARARAWLDNFELLSPHR